MREVKFRAWQNNRYIYSDYLGLDLFFSIVLYKKLEPEQFTGLKDKNGKEIYEGDICNIGENPSEDNPKGTNDGNTEIWFHEGRFLTRHYGFPVSSWACNKTCYIEVIGNKNKKPELRKERNNK